MDLCCPALVKSGLLAITNGVKNTHTHTHSLQKTCCSLAPFYNLVIKGSCIRPHDDIINLQGDQWAHSVQAIRYTSLQHTLALLVLCQAKQ